MAYQNKNVVVCGSSVKLVELEKRGNVVGIKKHVVVKKGKVKKGCLDGRQ